MNSFLKVAIMLTAYDQMSREIQAAVGRSKKELTDLKNHARNEFAQGMGLIGAGMVGVNAIVATEQAFMDLDQSTKDLQSTMQRAGGPTAEMNAQLADSMVLAKKLGDYLPGTTSEIAGMFTAMEQNGVPASEVLGDIKNGMHGAGEAAAFLSVVTKKGYAETGVFVAKLKEAAGIQAKDMVDFIDVIARADQAGAKAEEMSYAFARSGGALKMMKLQGLEASKSVSALFATLIRSGASGETIGTGITSVFNAMTNKSKMEEFNAALRQYGIQANFVDEKTGQFAGIENMIAQFEKIKKLGLGVEDQGLLTRTLLGPGADANFMNLLIDKGVDGFNKMTNTLSDQATIQTKVNIQMSSMKNKLEALDGTYTNFKATLGAALAPTINKVLDLLNTVISKMASFLEQNPKLAKFIMLIVAMVSAFLLLAGAFKIIMALKAAMVAFNIVCSANPYVLLAMAIIAIIAALYIWRQEIKKFFSNNPLFRIAALLLAPFVLVVVYFDEIIDFFGKLPERISRYGSKFYNAGKNIIKSIWDGMKSLAHKPVDAISGIVQKMRDFLPFSPAKVGPFRDLHKIKIIETIAGAMKPGPMVNAMSYAVGSAARATGSKVNPGGHSSGGGVTLHYAPVITFSGGGSKEDFAQILKEHAAEIMRLIKNETAKKERKKY